MTEDEALKKAREAMVRAVNLFGIDQAAIQRSLDAQARRDPALKDAFAITGRVLIQSEQHEKH
ncbi:hypothetical protein OYT13_13945 [Pandoraea sp. XJJ-1]|uniref:hypothetical protein n=1 Tax=Pandoraea sp. XJJ-1 TaxID=3002643 RepID=UPI00227EF5C4|nr:hypothetical protein [Pandoraea sp. XJJ-1]WAL80976.1 hypothetical protein OYT13_13945 [Pandoraea sp. XJJ-1]